MTTITEFLLARIAEDEAVALAASHQKLAGPFHGNWRHDSLHLSGMERDDAKHIARHDPARVLAECAAKRAIVAAHPIVDDVIEVSTRIKWGFACETCFSYGDVVEDNGYCDTIRALAAVYADHEDYQPEWVL